MQTGQIVTRLKGRTEQLMTSRERARKSARDRKDELEKATAELAGMKETVAAAGRAIQETELLKKKVEELEQAKADAESARKRMEDELEPKLAKARDEGFNEAGEEYQKMLPGILAKGISTGEGRAKKEIHPLSFRQGYLAGLDRADVPGNDPRRENISVPEFAEPPAQPRPSPPPPQPSSTTVPPSGLAGQPSASTAAPVAEGVAPPSDAAA